MKVQPTVILLILLAGILPAVLIMPSFARSAPSALDPDGSGPEEKTLPGGIRYTIHKKGTGKQLKLGDNVQLHYMLLNHRDSVISSTYEEGRPEMAVLKEAEYAGDPLVIFPELHEGDSLTVKVVADSFFKPYPGGVPARFQKGSEMQIRFKIIKVLTADDMRVLREETEARRRASAEEARRLVQESIARDSAIIQDYLTKNKYTAVAGHTPEGVYYVVTRKGRGRKPASGELLSVKYKGMLLDGTVFDKGPKGDFQFQLGSRSIIPGFNAGFSAFTEGTQAILLIPSRLAYGHQGSPPNIPADAVLRFDVELVRIVGSGK